jgi:hypothetical protein
MTTKNAYYYFQSVISPEDCQKIINLGNSEIERLKREGVDVSGTTFGDNHKQANPNLKPLNDKTISETKEDTFVRDSEVAWLKNDWLYNLILPFIKQANYDAGWRYDLDWYETFQFTVYRPGGFYGWHADGSSCHFSKYRRYIPGVSDVRDNNKMLPNHTIYSDFIGKVRKLSMTLNLNISGDYEGGNLKFDLGPHSKDERYHECIEIRPQGSLVVFPSSVYHQVTPVKKGTRYSLVLWCLGKPLR